MAHVFGSIWDRLNRNALNALSKSVEQQGKSIQDLVAEGQLTEEQYAELITVINRHLKSGDVDKLDLSKDLQTEINRLRDKINKGDVTLNDLRPDVLSAINNGDGTPFEILSIPRDRSVSAKKTTFISISTNLYDENEVIKNKARSRQNGQLVDDSRYNSTPIYSVSPGETYTVTPFAGVIFYDATGNFKRVQEQNPSPEGFTVTVRDGEYGMSFDFRNNSSVLPQINEGSVLLPYEKHYKEMDEGIQVNYEIKPGEIENAHIKDKTIGHEKIDFVKASSNLFNPADAHDNRIYSSSGEFLEDVKFVATPKYRTRGGETFSIKRFSRVVYFDGDDNFIGIREFTLTENTEGVSFTTPENCKTFGLHYQKIHSATPQLNKGSEVLPYEPYYIDIAGLKIIDEKNDDLTPHEKYDYVFTVEDVPLGFVAPTDDYERLTLSDLQAGWEDLFTKHPEYLKKTVLGKDTTGGHDIFKVRAAEDEYDGSITRLEGSNGQLVGKKPKIVFLGNIHGHEETSALAPYYLFKLICENWQSNEALEYLRFNVEFEFIPIVYPHGYDTGEYRNVTGINLQTNFPYNFSPRNPDSNVYGGEEPLTEIETVYCKELIDDNADAVFFADLHNPGYTEDFADNVDLLFYYLIGRDDQYNYDMDTITKSAVEFNTRLLKKEYTLTNDKFLSFVSIRDGNGTADAYAYSVGIPSVVMEIPKQFPGEPSSYGPNAMKSSVEVLANNFLLILKHYRDNQKGEQ